MEKKIEKKIEKNEAIEKAINHIMSCPMQDRRDVTASFLTDENIDGATFVEALKMALDKEQRAIEAKQKAIEAKKELFAKANALFPEPVKPIASMLIEGIEATLTGPNDGAKRVTVALAKGASMKDMEKIRGGVTSHLNTLKGRGFKYQIVDGIYSLTEIPSMTVNSCHRKLFKP